MTGSPSQKMRRSAVTAPPPRWDPAYRELRVGDTVVKEFRVPSPAQIAILSAFEEEGWPHRIDDPLSPLPNVEPKSRLHDAIKRLNGLQKIRLLRFRGDGTGEGVCWEYAAVTSFSLSDEASRESLPRAA
jgi:hypothetical protein